MASRRYYDSARAIGGKSSSIKRQSAKRKDAIQRGRQIRDAMAVAQVAFRPGGYQRGTSTAMLSERKVIDTNFAGYVFQAIGTPPAPTLLNGCIAGSQNYNRIGRKINNRSLQIRGFVFPTTPPNSTDQICRMLVIYDRQSNGVSPTWANVIQSQNISGTTSSAVTDMVNLDNRDRFVVLRDRVWICSSISNTATQAYAGSSTVHEVNEYIKLNVETIYNAGVAGTVGDITTGGVFVFFAGSAFTGGYSFAGSFRIRFEDL